MLDEHVAQKVRGKGCHDKLFWCQQSDTRQEGSCGKGELTFCRVSLRVNSVADIDAPRPFAAAGRGQYNLS